RRLTRGGYSATGAQHDQSGIVVDAALELVEARGRRESGLRGLFHHRQRGGREPAAGARRRQRALRQALAIGRIEEDERERLDRMRGAQPGGIAAEDLADAAEPERRDILANERA